MITHGEWFGEKENDAISIDERFDNIRVMIKDALKEWYCRGYEDGIKASQTCRDIAREELLDDIRTEIDNQYKWLMQTKCTLSDIDIAFDAIKSSIDNHIGEETVGNTDKLENENDLGDYPDTMPNQFDNMTGSMNL